HRGVRYARSEGGEGVACRVGGLNERCFGERPPRMEFEECASISLRQLPVTPHRTRRREREIMIVGVMVSLRKLGHDWDAGALPACDVTQDVTQALLLGSSYLAKCMN